MTKELMLSIVGIAGTSCMIAPDLVALVTTWVKTYHHVRQAASVGIKVSFGAKLIQYGMRATCCGTLTK